MSKHFMVCPMCNNGHYIRLNNDQDRRLFEYRNGDMLIQEALPDLNATEREFIKTGYCPKCQVLIFGSGESKLITRR